MEETNAPDASADAALAADLPISHAKLTVKPRKSEVVSFRVSPEVHAMLMSRAAESGLSSRAWFEQAILENRTQIVAVAKPHRELRPLVFQANKAGNLGDFFTKHLQKPWAEAQTVLRDRYHASISDALPPPDKALWRQFSKWRDGQFESVAARRSEEGAAFRSRILEVREEYQRRKAEAQPLPGRHRAAAVARARADQFIAQQVIAAERAKASAAARIPRRNAHYREYLVELATAGDTAALAELRRMAPHQPEPEAKISGGRCQPVFPLPSYSVDAKGAVTYRAGESAIVRDSSQGVTVLKAENSAYDAAIRVAIARYGRTLTLNGDARFVANMADAARRTGLDLTLRDASRPNAQPLRVHTRDR